MKSYPIISVVITACDRPVLFKRAFKSVVVAAKKLAKAVELIIVNDGKYPLEVDTTFVENLKIHYIQSPKGPYMGVAASRNSAIASANGEYLLFLDDDDELLETALSTLLNKAQSENFDLVYAGVDRVYETRTLTVLKKKEYKASHINFRNIEIANFIHIGSFVIKRCAIVSLFDTRLSSHEDWDFLIANSRAATVACVNESVANIYFCTQRVNRNPDTTVDDGKLEKYQIHKIIHQRYPSPDLKLQRAKLLNRLRPISDFSAKTIIDCKQLELLVLNPQETVQRALIHQNEFEPFVPGLALALLTGSSISGDVLDVGSSIGSFAIPVARGIQSDPNQQRQIHCFECQKSVFLHLCSHILINQQQTIINPNHQPLSDRVEEIRIPQFNPFEERFTGSVSLKKDVIETRSKMAGVAEPDTLCETYQVMQSNTVDMLFSDQEIALIKIDVEGMETMILKGAAQVIQKSRPFILTESWNLDEFSDLRNELLSLLTSLDYVLFIRENDIAALPKESLTPELESACADFKFTR